MVTGCVGTSGWRTRRLRRRLKRLGNEKPESRRLLRLPESESHQRVGPRSGEDGSSSRSEQNPKCGDPARDEAEAEEIARPLWMLTRIVSQLSSESDDDGLSYPPTAMPRDRWGSEESLERARGMAEPR